MFGIEFTLGDQDFFVPIEKSTTGTRYRLTAQPGGWQHRDDGVWTYWLPPGHVSPVQGWKVHVSARLERAQHVLDVVARVCGEHGTPFKHVRDDMLFLWLHHKHGPRTQSGKFCTAYPVDEAAARRLMVALHAALPTETGPYVLTDRRLDGSGVVSYRYGSFAPRFRVEPDGTKTPIITVDGVDVPDHGKPQFLLPPGVTDPFAPPQAAATAGPVRPRGYTFRAVLQFSNAGGAYRATAPEGREVFVKEARNDNGYQWDRTTAMQRLRREYETLQRLHAIQPGLCPDPVEYFRHGEQEFLVAELVPGVSLLSWMSRHNPMPRTGATGAAFQAYYDRCRSLLAALRGQINQIRAAGYAFVDLNPRNVLVDDQDRPRLIDFEEAQPLDDPRPVHGAEGFLPPAALRGEIRPEEVDEYALGAIAELLVQPVQGVLTRHPASAEHMLAELPALPPDLRAAAPRLRPPPASSALPSPEEAAAEPDRWLAWLVERVAVGLMSMADPTADIPYPLGPRAYGTNVHGVAHGTAGILYALHRAGASVPARMVDQLIDAILPDADNLPPGLFVGTAGMAWVLARLGRVEVARKLLAVADRYPLAGRDATLGYGTAGLALAHLAVARYDADPAHVTRAADLLAGVPDDAALIPMLGRGERTGWEFGRPGIALALHYLGVATGDPETTRRGRKLLLADLDESHLDGAGLKFQVSRKDSRLEPYLATGSAGFAFVAGRYVSPVGGNADDRLAIAHRRCLATVRGIRYPVLPGLFQGLAGMALVLSDLASRTGPDHLREDASRSGLALLKYAVPRAGGVCFLGPGNRFNPDLADGSAGVLLSLAQAHDGRPDALFTLDAA